MRVLGVDPGLTRCGLGVVEGALGRPLRMVAVGVVRTPADAPTSAQRLLALADRASTRGSTRTDPTPSRSSGSSPAQRPHGHGHRAGRGRRRSLAAARRGLPVALHTPSEVKAAVTGSGRADKAQVDRDGDPHPRGSPSAPEPADAADALALAICHVWRGGAAATDSHAAADRAPPDRDRWPPDDRVRPRTRSARPGSDSAVVEVGGVGLLVHVHARHARRRCGRARRRTLATTHGRARGLADPVRLRRRRRAGRLRAACRRCPGSGPRLALAMLAVHAPDALRAAVATDDLAALTQGAGHRQEGRRAHRARAARQDRRCPSGAPARGRAPPTAPARRGASRSARRWSASAGRPSRPTTPSTAVAPRPADAQPTCPALLRAALRELGRLSGRPSTATPTSRATARSTRPPGSSTPAATTTSGRSRRRCGPAGSASSSARRGSATSSALVLEAARRRGAPPDHVLLSGPPGLGKTTLAMIVAAEIEQPMRITSGPAIQHAGDLAAILSSLAEGEVLFLDEIHRMARPAEEMLYLAMEDFRVDVIVGKGPGATAIPLELAAVHRGRRHHPGRAAARPAARPVRLHRPPRLLRDRRPRARSSSRSAAAARRRRSTTTASPRSPRRSRGTPRIANRLLRRVRDWAQVRGDGVVDLRRPRTRRWRSSTSTSAGLDRLDRAVLEALCRRFGGGPVGLTHARRRGRRGVRDRRDGGRAVPRPRGLLVRTPRGRVATPLAWEHLGLTPPSPVAGTSQAALPLGRG